MIPRPQTISDSILKQLALFKRRDRSNTALIPLQRFRREAAKLKAVSPHEYYTVLGAIACLEDDIANMHKNHQKAISLSQEQNQELFNYMASLDIACLYDEAYKLAVNAFDKAPYDIDRLFWAIDKSEKTFRYHSALQYLKIWQKLQPLEPYHKEDFLLSTSRFMEEFGLSDDDMSAYFGVVLSILHKSGAVVSSMKSYLYGSSFCVFYKYEEDRIDKDAAAEELAQLTLGLAASKHVSVTFNGICLTDAVLHNRAQVAARILGDWGEVQQASASMQIVDYILSNGADASHITFGSLRKLLGDTYSDEHVFQAIQYLTGERIPILRTAFEFIDDDEETYVLTPDEIHEAKEEGKFAHPKTGELVADYQKKVHIFFQPGPLAKEIGK